jgi:predicted ATPase
MSRQQPGSQSTKASHDFFVSYASADRQRADAIIQALTRAGITVWIDQMAIYGGASYGEAIARGIREARAVLLLSSKAALASRNVHQEIVLAWHHQRPVVPLRLEPASIPLELEYWLTAVQWIDVLDRPETDWLPQVRAALERLRTGSPSRASSIGDRRDQSTPGRPPPNNLPVPLTPFVGRVQEQQDILALIRSHRLVTLVGAGGTGKTRLALEVARLLLNTEFDEIWFAPLETLANPEIVAHAVMTATGIHDRPKVSPEAALIHYLRPRRVLLVLDNCEHVVQAVATLAQSLVGQCPNLSLLSTSREPLGVPGEVLYRVPGLSMPAAEDDSAEAIAMAEAVRLFADRVAAHDPSFSLNATNAQVIAHICRRLDGIPLALELAAARVPFLGVAGLSARLDDRFRLLTGGSRTALPRQQTLRGLIDWSFDLLPEPERLLLARLGVFTGGWTLDAAEAICAGDPIPANAVLDLLGQLVTKSLVITDGTPVPRFGMLESIHQYASERLAERGGEFVVRRAHAEYYLALADQDDATMHGPGMPQWLDRLDVEHPNLRAALAFFEETGDFTSELRLANALAGFWYQRGHLREGCQRLHGALTRGAQASAALRAQAMAWLALLHSVMGESATAVAYCEESYALAMQAGSKDTAAQARYFQALAVGWGAQHWALASRLAQEAVDLLRSGEDQSWLLPYALGDHHRRRPPPGAGRGHARSCLRGG